jgi:neutral trehalase
VGYRARRPTKDTPKLRFKSNDSAKSFRQRVHQAMLDCCETNDTPSHEEQHYIHMADADDFVDPADVEEGTYEMEETDDDNGIAALVAAGLGNLLKE